MASSNYSALSRFLRRLLRRSILGVEEQNAILNLRSHAAQVQKNERIVSPGETIDQACLVVDGMIGRFDQMLDGRRQTVAFHLPGDMCDLHSVVSPTVGWGLEAITTTTILWIPHPDLTALVEKYPAIAMAFWRDTTTDASILAKWASNLGRRAAPARLAHLLCELGLRAEQASLGSRNDFPLEATQIQLADALGLTPVHINRTMQFLKREQLVHTVGGVVYVPDFDRLACLADFDPTYLLLDHRDDDADTAPAGAVKGVRNA